MPVVQDTFALDYAVGFPGMVANGEVSNRITRSADKTIKFGAACFEGAAYHGCTDATAGGAAKFLGIAIVDHGEAIFPGGPTDAYVQYANVPIMQRGEVWVQVGAAGVARGAQVAVLDADGTYVAAGAGATSLPGWIYDHAASAGQMAKISNNRHAPV